MTDKNFENFDVTDGSENVFADLGFADAPEMLVKAELPAQIIRTIRELGPTQQQAGRRVGLRQPDISNIVNTR